MAFSGTFLSQISLVPHKYFNSESAEYGYLYAADNFEGSPAPIHRQSTPLDNDISSSGVGSGQTNDSDEYTESPYPGILDADLAVLTTGQKNFFIVTVTLLCLLSVVGNVSTLVVNFRRKIRPFFRACLISLAFSDLMNTLFLSVSYLSQFIEDYVQIWNLGPLMCSMVPFATTAAILASSMTLVGIAVDRYYAVMKAVIGFWNPTVISCIVCMLCIWLASIGIASPVFVIYDLQPVYILTEEPEMDVSGAATLLPTIPAEGGSAVATRKSNETATTTMGTTKTDWEVDASQEDLSYILIKEQKLVAMCVSEQKDVTLYYVIVFVIIFIPCIVAFFWFNTIIARKLWNRRHSVSITNSKPTVSNKKPQTGNSALELQNPHVIETPQLDLLKPPDQNCNNSSSTTPSRGGTTTTTTTNTNCSGNAASAPVNATSRNSREARHLRMFTIILLMMAVFLFLRLPAWIFLLMRMYGSYNTPTDWIIYFAFGVMNLASSVLNPLFYTFLSETIQYALNFKAKVTTWICGGCSKIWCCCCCRSTNVENMQQKSDPMANVREPSLALSCCEGFCGCSGFLRATWQCNHLPKERQEFYSTGNRAKEYCAKDSNDKDEGVDCSDVIEDDITDHDLYNRRIYTIYPASLVSSSMESH